MEYTITINKKLVKKVNGFNEMIDFIYSQEDIDITALDIDFILDGMWRNSSFHGLNLLYWFSESLKCQSYGRKN